METKKIDDSIILELKDALTVSNIEEFKRSVEGVILTGINKIIVDFEGVPYIDSSGLSALLTASEMALERGGVLLLAAMNETCSTILEITFLTEQFEIFPDVESALDY